MLHVALAYNVKPDEAKFEEMVQAEKALTDSINYNDVYAEWDTFETIYAIRDALSLNNKVTLVEGNDEAFEKFKALKPDIVFNVTEGAFGISREAQIPAMLDMLRIPYTGSDPLTLTTCLDKGRTKEVLSYHNIPNSKFLVITTISEIDDCQLEFPLILKPLQEGSSKGVTNSCFVKDKKSLYQQAELLFGKYNQPIIIEEFLPGREFTVAMLGNGDAAQVLPIIEISFDDFPNELLPIYSYEAKWIYDTREKPLNIYSCPANIDDQLENKIKDIALKTFKVLNCKDWSRIDIRLDKNGIPNIIEINPLPGILPDPDYNSCFPKAARAVGMDYNQMINAVLNNAVKRYGLNG